MGKNYYILMADVKDSRLKKGSKLINSLLSIVKEKNKTYKSLFLSPLTVTLGDEFQSVLKSFADAIKIIIAIEEELIKENLDFKLRYILHYGVIDTPINSEIAYNMYGQGLISAREMLEKNKKIKDKRIYISCKNLKSSNIIELAFQNFTSYIDKWNKKDYKLIYSLIHQGDKTEKEIADDLNYDPAGISRRKRTLKIIEYKNLKNIIYFLANNHGI